jgi:tripartite-type tricarboxylate transporter receptor subunit TctC
MILKSPMAVLRIAVLSLCAATAVAAHAQNYPTQPVRVIVPFPPGAGVDIVTRLVAVKLSIAMGQQFIVENRSGAGGNVGAAEAARAAPDGYTLLAAPSSIAVSQSLYKNLSFNVEKDFRAVAMMASVPFVLVVNPTVPAKSVAELIALAKSKPGLLTFASTGNGSSPHLTAEMFKMQAGVDLSHVPYRGSAPAMTDLMSDQVNMMFANALSVLPQVQSGRLTALAITSKTRSASAPTIPTMIEAGLPGFESATWFAILAPNGTPQFIINRLNMQVARIMQLADVQKTLALQGATTGSGSPAEVDAYIKAEVEKYAKIVKASGTRID